MCRFDSLNINHWTRRANQIITPTVDCVERSGGSDQELHAMCLLIFKGGANKSPHLAATATLFGFLAGHFYHLK
jgi:hypothetical protein